MAESEDTLARGRAVAVRVDAAAQAEAGALARADAAARAEARAMARVAAAEAREAAAATGGGGAFGQRLLRLDARRQEYALAELLAMADAADVTEAAGASDGLVAGLQQPQPSRPEYSTRQNPEGTFTITVRQGGT